MIYIFAGLPGTGKTELSSHLAQILHAVYLRVDSIEHAIRQEGKSLVGPEGYAIACAVAADNLRQGKPVVVDCVNPIARSREAFRAVAKASDCVSLGIEVVCSDLAEHRKRVETRTSSIAGFRLPCWGDVMERDYQTWAEADLVIDTAGERPDQSKAGLEALLTESLH